ncbi:MAG: cysteine desulfurase family protein [Candidatus Izemoplasmataceae bacterium]
MLYMDYAATTPASDHVRKAMDKALEDFPGNPNSLHTPGIEARKRYNRAKKSIAKGFNTHWKNIIITGSGSEASNTAIKGYHSLHPEKAIVLSTIEHAATMNSAAHVEKTGGKVLRCPVDSKGFVRMDTLEDYLSQEDVGLVSIIHSNNEIGTVQDAEKLRALTKKHGALLHLDMVQTAPHMPVDLDGLDVDMASFSAHKFFGPRGVGVLFKKASVEIEPLIHGGSQEFNLRAGTENVSGVVGFETALNATLNDHQKRQNQIRKNGEAFLNALEREGIDFILNGPDYHSSHRLHNVLNLGFESQNAAALAFELNQRGIYVSQGSACHENSVELSHVLKGIRVGKSYIQGSLRFSISHRENENDMKAAARTIAEIIKSGESEL